eukprot:530051-Rhodomonas_salina.1
MIHQNEFQTVRRYFVQNMTLSMSHVKKSLTVPGTAAKTLYTHTSSKPSAARASRSLYIHSSSSPDFDVSN